MSVKFSIERYTGEPTTGFDLGDFIFDFDGHIISSNRGEKFGGMIYIALGELVDGITSIRDKNKFRFVLTDSSFSIIFKKEKGRIAAYYLKDRVGMFSLDEFLRAISDGVDAFLKEEQNRLSENDRIFKDFEFSLRKLRAALT